MTIEAASAGVLVLAGLAASRLTRAADRRAEKRVWDELVAHGTPDPERFDPSSLGGLPEPARRYLRFAIAPGTPLRRVALIEMEGRFGLGDRHGHAFHPMRARQVLAPPFGLLWIVEMGSGALRMGGSDALAGGQAWTRIWLSGLLPLARTSGGSDLARSAAGRLIGESLWAPASLLPQDGVRWEEVDSDTARAIMRIDGEEHAFDLTVADDGRPIQLVLRRWSNANPDKRFRWQPFGATFGRTATFEGFTVPVEVSGGNHFGADDYFPFFQARVTGVSFR